MARFVLSTPALSQPVGVQFLRLAEQLRDDGHNVVLLVFREGPGSPSADVDLDRGGSLSVMRWPSDPPTKIADATFFAALLRRMRPDCVVGQMESTNWTTVLSWATRVPVRVAWYHMLMRQVVIDGAGWSLPLRVRRRSVVYRCATNLVSVSSVGVDDLVGLYGVDRRRCVVIPNGLDAPSVVDGRPDRRPDDRGVRMLSVGRLVPSKGHAALIRSVADLVSSGVRCSLTIVGEGPERGALESEIGRHDLGAVVRLRGGVDHHEIQRLLREADLYVHPALCDNNPLALIEATSVGLPIVATSVGGIPEMLSHDEHAILVPPDDSAALASALTRLVDDWGARRRLGEAARRRFDEAFDVRHWVRRTAGFLLGETERMR